MYFRRADTNNKFRWQAQGRGGEAGWLGDRIVCLTMTGSHWGTGTAVKANSDKSVGRD